jgi:hypothetical protein
MAVSVPVFTNHNYSINFVGISSTKLFLFKIRQEESKIPAKFNVCSEANKIGGGL